MFATEHQDAIRSSIGMADSFMKFGVLNVVAAARLTTRRIIAARLIPSFPNPLTDERYPMVIKVEPGEEVTFEIPIPPRIAAWLDAVTELCKTNPKYRMARHLHLQWVLADWGWRGLPWYRRAFTKRPPEPILDWGIPDEPTTK